MLNEKEKSVLNFVNANSDSGSYALIELDDVKNSMDGNVKNADILKAFYALERLEYIKIKYDDGVRLCVISTARGRNYLSGVELAEIALNSAKEDFNSVKDKLLNVVEETNAAISKFSVTMSNWQAKLNESSLKKVGFTIAFSFMGGFTGAVLAVALIVFANG